MGELQEILNGYTRAQVETFWMIVGEHRERHDTDWKVSPPDDESEDLAVGVPDGALWVIYTDGSFYHYPADWKVGAATRTMNRGHDEG